MAHGDTGKRGSAELAKHSQQRGGGERSEKRQDNPGIRAEFDKKWTNLTLFLVLEMLEYFVWICPILKLFFTLHDMKKSMSELNCPTVHEKLRCKSWSRTEVLPSVGDAVMETDPCTGRRGRVTRAGLCPPAPLSTGC